MNWRLVAVLGDHGIRREVSLDYEDRALLDEQASQIGAPTPYWAGHLYEFRNERGDVLAFLSSAYVSHRVVDIRPRMLDPTRHIEGDGRLRT